MPAAAAAADGGGALAPRRAQVPRERGPVRPRRRDERRGGEATGATINGAAADGGADGEAAPPPTNTFFGVYDGHGGSAAAAHTAARLHALLAVDAQWRTDPRAALAGAFAAVEAELRLSYESTRDKSGSCALGLLLRGHRALLANVGDCRALVVRAESSHAPPYVQLTTDQRATEPGEQSRILKAGGQISDGRVWGALIPSRTLGDFPWKAKGPGLSALPEFCSYEIGPDDRYIILGSDGLFDVLTNKAIARIAGRMSGKAQKVANELVKELKKRPGHDDQTLVVVALEH